MSANNLAAIFGPIMMNVDKVKIMLYFVMLVQKSVQEKKFVLLQFRSISIMILS